MARQGEYHSATAQQRHINVKNIVSIGDKPFTGDCNGGYDTTVEDATMLRKYLLNLKDGCNALAADVNADNVVNILDLVRLKKMIAG